MVRIFSRDSRERQSRIDKLLEEFYNMENFPFFITNEEYKCSICASYKEEKICSSLHELSKHFFKHKGEDADVIIYAQEAILQVLLKKKLAYENNQDRFSN